MPVKTLPLKAAIVAGTRPEAIKLIPVRDAFDRQPAMKATFITSGQHKEMLVSVLNAFDTSADISLDLMVKQDTLSGLFGRLMQGLQVEFARGDYDLVVEQGDTSTALAAALAAHYNRILIVYVEAGLRAGDKCALFPEESHRRRIAAISDFHFAATQTAAATFIGENIHQNVPVVVNTIIDALLMIKQRIEQNLLV